MLLEKIEQCLLLWNKLRNPNQRKEHLIAMANKLRQTPGRKNRYP